LTKDTLEKLLCLKNFTVDGEQAGLYCLIHRTTAEKFHRPAFIYFEGGRGQLGHRYMTLWS